MTAIRLDPTTSTPPSGRTTRLVRVGALSRLALVAVVVLSWMASSPLSVLIAVGIAIVLAVAAYLWNDPGALFPVAMYVMWFEALPPGPVNSGRVVAFLAVALPVARVLTSRWRIPAIQPRVWLPTVCLLAWAVLSLLWSQEAGAWANGLLTLFLGISYAFLFAIFVESPEQAMGLFKVFIVIGVVIAGLSATVHYGLGYRSFGFTGGPNQYALINVQAVPIAVVLARRSTGLWRWFFVLAVPALFIGTLAAGSRSGLIGLGAIGVFCFVFRPNLTLRQRAMWSVIGFFGVLAGFLLAGILDPERFSPAGLLSDRGAGRLDIWTAGLYGLQHNWVLGYGIGGFAKQALGLIQRATGASLDVARQEEFRATNTIPAHNIYLQAVLDLGIIGGVLYFGTLLIAMKNLWDMLKTEWHDIAWIGLGCLTAFLAMGPFASQLNPKMPWAMVGLPGAYFVRRALTDRQDRRVSRLGGPLFRVDR
jgi:O-antigen ligase